jgi:hypothetical protein
VRFQRPGDFLRGGGHFLISFPCLGVNVFGTLDSSGRQLSSEISVLRADDSLIAALAEILFDRIAERLGPVDDGFLDAEGAARHLSTSRQRVHELTSARTLKPDGYDGRRPLYRRASLDRYVEGGEGR